MKDKKQIEFEERVKCGIAYCENTTVDEIKQDFKKHEEKHKQIKEMAEIIESVKLYGVDNYSRKISHDSTLELAKEYGVEVENG